ncbi:MAG: ATP-grasp domain-containing protein [Dehalococcoidales bacterium]|nr:ATP-grasp domain-containing protein [Dehalococcoidales bacterium]
MILGRRIAVVYNEPHPSRYDAVGEEKAARDVLESVAAVCRALCELGDDGFTVPLAPPVEVAKERLRSLKADLVFNLFEGFCGQPETEALVPQVLSRLRVPYTGCPAAALALALDKAKSKQAIRAAGIKTPDFQLLTPEMLPQFSLRYPCLVKPRSEDASHGLSPDSVVSDPAALERQVARVCRLYGGEALVEEFIAGREFNATVIGDGRGAVLPVSEIAYELPPGLPRILTFDAKWQPDSAYFRGTKAVCPAQITSDLGELITDTARLVFRLVCRRGYGRVDMRQDGDGRLQIIEVNPNPDIAPGSGAVLQAEAAGMSYPRFIKKIVELALEKS